MVNHFLTFLDYLAMIYNLGYINVLPSKIRSVHEA